LKFEAEESKAKAEASRKMKRGGSEKSPQKSETSVSYIITNTSEAYLEGSVSVAFLDAVKEESALHFFVASELRDDVRLLQQPLHLAHLA